jgi:hypothetical protein
MGFQQNQILLLPVGCVLRPLPCSVDFFRVNPPWRTNSWHPSRMPPFWIDAFPALPEAGKGAIFRRLS